MAKTRKLKVENGGASSEALPVARAALEMVRDAIIEFGTKPNKHNLVRTDKIRGGRLLVIHEIQKREELKSDIIKQYDETGQGWPNVADAPKEAVEKILALLNETITLNFGEPIKLSDHDRETLVMEEPNYSVLKEVGFIA